MRNISTKEYHKEYKLTTDMFKVNVCSLCMLLYDNHCLTVFRPSNQMKEKMEYISERAQTVLPLAYMMSGSVFWS